MSGFKYNIIGFLAEALVWIKARSRNIPVWRGEFKKTMRYYRFPLEGMVSSDGSPYYIFIKRGRIDKTLIHFAGGGFSWDEETAAMPLSIRALANKRMGYYVPSCGSFTDLSLNGIISENDPRNPINDLNMVVIPYTTGDLHIGNNDFPYKDKKGAQRVLHHHGKRNFAKAMETASAVLPLPDEIVISGNSAGGFGCVVLAPEIAGMFPDCKRITVLSDGTQLCCRDFKRILLDVWKADPSIADKIGEDGEIIRDMINDSAKELGERALFLHVNTIHDHILCKIENMMITGRKEFSSPSPDEFYRRMSAAMSELSDRLPNYHYYLSDCGRNSEGFTEHTLIPNDRFFEQTAGLSPADWLKATLAAQGGSHSVLLLQDG